MLLFWWKRGLAMMASIGLVAQHYWKLPGFENLPSGFSILGKEEGVIGLFALFLVSGCLENVWREDPSGTKEPGNFGDPFGLQMYNEEMRTKELNNGRMAMISVLGIFAAEMASGQDAIQQFGLWAMHERNSICTAEWSSRCFNLECIRTCTSAHAAQFRIFSPCNKCKRDSTLPKPTMPDHVVTIWETQTQFLRIFELSLAPTKGLPAPSQCSPFCQKHLEPWAIWCRKKR